MIRHIVFFRFPGIDKKEEFLKDLKKRIENLGERIEVLESIEAGINFSDRDSAYDIALVSDFNSKADLDVYRTHPDHLKLLDFLKSYKKEIAVVDYEL